MKVALRATKDGTFVSARFDEPNAPLRATRPNAGPWETFELVLLEANETPPQASAPWPWRGCTDFRLAQRQMAGEDIRPLVLERVALGANRLRVLAMKANNTGWDLVPQGRADYWGDVRRFFDTTAPMVGIEWTVFADTRLLPQFDYQTFWHTTCDTVRQYPHVTLECLNEDGHPTQRVRASEFERPIGVFCSHGSGLTDANPPSPRWDYATYHARRDGAKGFSNYSPYEFQSVYPQPCPLIADEGAKPEDYGYNVAYARLMGLHAATGWGGTFHTNAGVDSQPFDDATKACAQAFFAAIR